MAIFMNEIHVIHDFHNIWCQKDIRLFSLTKSCRFKSHRYSLLSRNLVKLEIKSNEYEQKKNIGQRLTSCRIP